jgi:ribonuclease HI
MGRYVLYADGAARGNPGPAAIGAVMFDDDGNPVTEVSETIGEATNNVAEYRALIAGLEAATRFEPQALTVRLDSQLLVRQLSGEYRVKAKNLKPLYEKVRQLLGRFPRVTIEHVPRERNEWADRLANQALDA